MASKHPYTPAVGPLIQTVQQLRRAFPGTVNAETLKRLGLAASNEAHVINILRYLGVLGDDGSKAAGATVFTRHNDADFQEGFAELMERAYGDLFALHGHSAWTLDKDRLTSYFRNADQSSALVGGRQAGTFQALAALSGRTDAPPTRKGSGQQGGGQSATGSRRRGGAKTPQPAPIVTPEPPAARTREGKREIGMSVRIEINLPAAGDQETYDRIFRSMRENLLGGE